MIKIKYTIDEWLITEDVLVSLNKGNRPAPPFLLCLSAINISSLSRLKYLYEKDYLSYCLDTYIDNKYLRHALFMLMDLTFFTKSFQSNFVKREKQNILLKQKL